MLAEGVPEEEASGVAATDSATAFLAAAACSRRFRFFFCDWDKAAPFRASDLGDWAALFAVFAPHRPASPVGRVETGPGTMRRLVCSTRAAEGGTAVPNLDFLVDAATGFITRALKLAAGIKNICTIIESASPAH